MNAVVAVDEREFRHTEVIDMRKRFRGSIFPSSVTAPLIDQQQCRRPCCIWATPAAS